MQGALYVQDMRYALCQKGRLCLCTVVLDLPSQFTGSYQVHVGCVQVFQVCGDLQGLVPVIQLNSHNQNEIE